MHLLQDCLRLLKVKIKSNTTGLSEEDTEPLKTSNMDLFVAMVNGFKLFIIITKSSILDTCKGPASASG